MKTPDFTPEESLALIEAVIKQAKNKFEENGFAFILWGSVIALCCFAQAYLIHLGMGSQSWYPYLIIPFVSVYTLIHYTRKKDCTRNPLNRISSRLWLFTGINIMIVSFGYSNEFKNHLSVVIFLLLGIATVVASSFIRSRLLLFCGIILNLSAYIAFYVTWKHHPLLMGTVSIVAFLIPGIVLHLKHKKAHV